MESDRVRERMIWGDKAGQPVVEEKGATKHAAQTGRYVKLILEKIYKKMNKS